jgi:hypothetical protein
VTVTVWSLYTALAAPPLRREELPSLHRLAQISQAWGRWTKAHIFLEGSQPLLWCYPTRFPLEIKIMRKQVELSRTAQLRESWQNNTHFPS